VFSRPRFCNQCASSYMKLAESEKNRHAEKRASDYSIQNFVWYIIIIVIGRSLDRYVGGGRSRVIFEAKPVNWHFSCFWL
jgi:hypothetical protein